MSLPLQTYLQVEQAVPLACVDFVPIDQGRIGLILRESPFGRVWCHLGGRVFRGETLALALRRHARETLAVDLVLSADPQPQHVHQWFPPDLMPSDGELYGVDPRKHAVGLCYAVEIAGTPTVQNEALAFAWYEPHRLPDPLWPGTAGMLNGLLARLQREEP